LQKGIAQTLKDGEEFGKVNVGKRKLTQVEFVSANPSGQLHVGNGRSAFFGDVLSNVLAAAGYKVEREYYVNDARVSKQMQALGETALGHGTAYLSPYLKELIAKLGSRLSKFISESEGGYYLAQQVLKDLKKFTAKRLGIKFDAWVSEESIYKLGLVRKAYELLKEKNLVVEREGAYWLDMAAFNQKDEVLLRANGMPTYFLSDIAYHSDKINRGYKKIIDIWGADHQGHVPRMKAVMEILGYKGEFEVLICQIVTIKGGKISKREGNIVALDWLIDEVGVDAARFFYLQKALSSQMEFDVELAKKKSQDSPVFYAQYAYARLSSILRKAKIGKAGIDPAMLKLLVHDSEIALAKELLRLPEIIEDSAKDFQMQRLCQYVLEVAARFHAFYRDCHVITEDAQLTQARLLLVLATKTVLKNTFNLLGISAPSKM
jgi:arginyl-tRNA synthetase